MSPTASDAEPAMCVAERKRWAGTVDYGEDGAQLVERHAEIAVEGDEHEVDVSTCASAAFAERWARAERQ